MKKYRNTILNIMGFNGCNNKTLVDTKIPKVKQQALTEKLQNAPKKGRLLVTGTVCPLAHIMLDSNKSVVAISFPEYFSDRFSDEPIEKPKAKDVVVIRHVGLEPAKNYDYSKKLLEALLEYYAETLVVIETNMTKNNFELTYGLVINTHITLQEKEEDSWLL